MEFPFRKLLRCRHSLEPLAWWEGTFGRDFSSVQPFLIPCSGRRADFFPCPDNPSVRMSIRESGRKYRAFPPSEHTGAIEDLVLDWKDVQAHRIGLDQVSDSLRRAFNLLPGAAPQLESLEFIGRCDCNGEFRQVFACFADSAPATLSAVTPVTDPRTVGCILFPANHSVAADLLRSRGIASVSLRECLSLEKTGFSGECSRNCSKCRPPDISNLELKQHIDSRMDSVGRKFADLEAENERLKGDMAKIIANIASQVDPEYFKWIYIVLASGSVSKAASALDIPNSTFAKRLKDGSARGGLYQTLFDLTTKRKGCGVKSVEHYNPEFAAHQSSDFQTVDSVQELLNGLEALNAANWQKMRGELIELVRSDFG